MKKEMKMYASPKMETCEILLKTGICSGNSADFNVDPTTQGGGPSGNPLFPFPAPGRALIK